MPRSPLSGKSVFQALIGVFIGVGVMIAGGVGLVAGVGSLKHARASESWPTASGGVKSCEVVAQSGRRGRTSYKPKVTVYFTVDGRRYACERLTFNASYSTRDRSEAEAFARRFAAGSTVSVSYKPDDPEISVIEPGVEDSAWLTPILGGAFAVVGAFITISTLRKLRD
ncbi:MAG: DUF3592 domain-containing protein [Phycisphaerales bacterium]